MEKMLKVIMTVMILCVKFGRPDKEENDKEKKWPDNLNQQTAPVTLSKSEVLPEQQLELKEESHLGLFNLGLGLLSLLFNPLLSFAFWSL